MLKRFWKSALAFGALALVPASSFLWSGAGAAPVRHDPWAWLPRTMERVHTAGGHSHLRMPVSGVVVYQYSPTTGNLPAVAPGRAVPGAQFTNVKVNQDLGPFPHNETSAVVAAHYPSPPYPHLMAGANDYRIGDGGNGVYNSHNSGQTWRDFLEQGVQSAPPYFQIAGDPSLTANSYGDVFYASLGADRNTSRSSVMVGRLEYRYGSEWADPWPTMAVYNNDGTFNDKEWIAADKSSSKYANNLYVTWTRFGSASPINVMSSSDNAMTWTQPVEISGSSTALCGGPCQDDQGSQVAVDGKGNVDVSFFNGDAPKGSGAQILFVQSKDGGKTWTSPSLVSMVTPIPSPLNGAYFRDNSFPAMTVDPQTNEIYLAWSDYGKGEADVMYTTSMDGKTWSKPQIVNPDRGGAVDHFFPAVATTGGGYVYLTYYKRPQGPEGQMLYMVSGSSTAGKKWKEVTASDTYMPNPVQFDGQFFGDYSAVAAEPTGAGGDIVHPVWMDTRSGFNQDIYTAQVTFKNL